MKALILRPNLAASLSAVAPFLCFLWHQRAILTTSGNICARTSYFYCFNALATDSNLTLFSFPTPKLGRRQIGMQRRSRVQNFQDQRKPHAPLITRRQLQGIHILLGSKNTNLWNALKKKKKQVRMKVQVEHVEVGAIR